MCGLSLEWKEVLGSKGKIRWRKVNLIHKNTSLKLITSEEQKHHGDLLRGDKKIKMIFLSGILGNNCPG